MKRIQGGTIAFVSVLLALAAQPARAQFAMAGPELPVATDLAKVPVGAWSEYSMTMTGSPEARQRYALVARNKNTHTIEMTFDGGPLGANTMRLCADLEWVKDRPVPGIQNATIQINDDQPMSLPPVMQQVPIGQLNPATRQAKETLTVAAGRFQTERYREVTADGRTVTTWISKDALPFGLVKLVIEQPNGPRTTLELRAQGKNAKRHSTASPRPFDATALMGAVDAAATGAVKR